MKNLIIFVFLFSLGLFCCSTSIDQTMVIGKYEANHQKGIDTLELLRDGTYKYYYSFDGKEVTNSNSWEFKS